MRPRIGRSGQLIPQTAADRECDLIALGWSQELSPGRAPVIRETLERSSRPVLLVPVRPLRRESDALAGSVAERTGSLSGHE